MIVTTPNNNSFFVDSSNDVLTGKSKVSDRWILSCVILLMVAGILAVYSSIAYFAESHNTTAFTLVFGHVVKLAIALSVMLIFSKIRYDIVAGLSKYALILSWFFLIIVTLHGTEVFGAKRFLNVAGFSFQPSSLATISLLIYLSVKLVDKAKRGILGDFRKTFIPLIVIIGVTCFLIGIEDLSSALVLMALSLLLMFIGRVSFLQLSGFVLLGILGGYLLLSQTVERQSRIQNYVEQVIHIKSDEFALTSGYQAQQAHIAIAKGGFFGVGVGKSTQRDFLPAPYNDFIFAIIAEEYGIMGAGVILLLYLIILIRGVTYVAKKAFDTLGALVALACTFTFVIYGFVNAAVATGLMPVTGLPMPFISYGGTSMLFSGMMIGILLNISKYTKEGK